jgi:phenylalanyl-tRNA synthetase beta chain
VKVSLEWLREYIDLDMNVEEIAETLSMSGTEVERVTSLGGGVTGVVVGEVLEVKEHPAADTLRLAVVDDGVTVREIVCGAPNLRAGMKSAFAREGATLPAISSKPLKKAKIRGIESSGMLLAGDELGISEDHDGILEFPEDTPVGIDLAEVLPLDDVVLELEITPNRPDCMSMVGIARELSAVTGAEVRMPPAGLDESGPPIGELARVVLEDPAGCPRYTARAVLGVATAPSPPWMQRRLTAAGLRPISNVVDVTNYVLLELGQPLHAFDLDLLAERTIIVRRARAEEKMTTLDGVERVLDEECVVIADAAAPVALAGIIGGEDSEVKDTSTDILIESAHFDPTSVLLTSKRLGVRTEASGRFERGVDPGSTDYAAARAARLMYELAGGRVAAGAIDAYPTVTKPVTIELRAARANRMIGIDITAGEMASILRGLGCEVVEGERLSVTVPTFRRDLEREIDLIEEIARIYGYAKIPETVPAGGGFEAGLKSEQRLDNELGQALVAQGLCQVMTYSFMSPEDLEASD